MRASIMAYREEKDGAYSEGGSNRGSTDGKLYGRPDLTWAIKAKAALLTRVSVSSH